MVKDEEWQEMDKYWAIFHIWFIVLENIISKIIFDFCYRNVEIKYTDIIFRIFLIWFLYEKSITISREYEGDKNIQSFASIPCDFYRCEVDRNEIEN